MASRKHSKHKGNVFENSIAKQIRNYFIPATVPNKVAYNLIHRTGLSGGRTERSDIVIQPPLLQYFPWFIECKNRESWDWAQILKAPFDNPVFSWYTEAVEKCHDFGGTEKRDPVLVFTKNFQPNYVLVKQPEEYDPTYIRNLGSSSWFFTLRSESLDAVLNVLLFDVFLCGYQKPDPKIFEGLDFK